jgi:methionine-rich copper-binding protein CopC
MIKQYILALLFTAANVSIGFSDVTYSDPVPNARFVSVQNSIIIGFSERLSAKQSGAILNITGSKSGKIDGRYIFTEDNKKILFIPGTDFKYEEIIHVKLNPGVKYKNGAPVSSFSFTFTVQSQKPAERNNSTGNTYNGNYFPPFNPYFDNSGDDLPIVNISIINNPAPGRLFFSNFPFGPIPNSPHLMISDNTGETYFAVNIPAPALDFKKQFPKNSTK